MSMENGSGVAGRGCVTDCVGEPLGAACTVAEECCAADGPVGCHDTFFPGEPVCCRPFGTTGCSTKSFDCCGVDASDGTNLFTHCGAGVYGGDGALCLISEGGIDCVSGTCCVDPENDPAFGLCC